MNAKFWVGIIGAAATITTLAAMEIIEEVMSGKTDKMLDDLYKVKDQAHREENDDLIEEVSSVINKISEFESTFSNKERNEIYESFINRNKDRL